MLSICFLYAFFHAFGVTFSATFRMTFGMALGIAFASGFFQLLLRELWGESEDDSGDTEYARRSLIYDRIFDALDLKNWLYGREGRFERICMSGIKTSEQADELYRMAVAFAHKIRV